jgi:hypothetical protein
MKLLLENWRKFLLTEAAMTIEDLMNFKDDLDLGLEMYIRARKNQEGGIELSYASIDSRGEPYMLGNDALVRGEIEIVLGRSLGFDDIGPCDGAYQVKWSTATEGWGPLLYDVAIEYATMHGNGLIADRDMISDDARAVWDYYLGQRKDVDNHQLDDLEDTLTPEIEVDNCAQDITAPEWEHSGTAWRAQILKDSPLSKRYTKKPTTIVRLLKLKGRTGLPRFIDET